MDHCANVKKAVSSRAILKRSPFHQFCNECSARIDIVALLCSTELCTPCNEIKINKARSKGLKP